MFVLGDLATHVVPASLLEMQQGNWCICLQCNQTHVTGVIAGYLDQDWKWETLPLKKKLQYKKVITEGKYTECLRVVK